VTRVKRLFCRLGMHRWECLRYLHDVYGWSGVGCCYIGRCRWCGKVSEVEDVV